MVAHRAFVTRTFRRWFRRTALSERELCAAVEEMTAGLVDADLGGHLFKKRIGLPGRGKRGGARVLVGTNLGNRWFFLYGFEKNERGNVDDRELTALKKLASALLKLSAARLAQERTL
ncbi:MAG: type II toxin-antitoxin system RelE/ParE family toxin [Gammaproteobacteria bacterium]